MMLTIQDRQCNVKIGVGLKFAFLLMKEEHIGMILRQSEYSFCRSGGTLEKIYVPRNITYLFI